MTDFYILRLELVGLMGLELSETILGKHALRCKQMTKLDATNAKHPGNEHKENKRIVVNDCEAARASEIDAKGTGA